jgi:hypothetical protein
MSNFTPEQMKWALSEIAHKASIAQTLCNEAIAAPDEDRETQSELIVAARFIVEQMGWIADHHSEAGQRGGATQWMLPPVYHEKPTSA